MQDETTGLNGPRWHAHTLDRFTLVESESVTSGERAMSDRSIPDASKKQNFCGQGSTVAQPHLKTSLSALRLRQRCETTGSATNVHREMNVPKDWGTRPILAQDRVKEWIRACGKARSIEKNEKSFSGKV